MAIEWTSSAKASATGGVKMLVYSESGFGKTMLAATAPRPVIISAESGLLSLSKRNIERLHGVNTPGITYDVPAMQVTTTAQLKECFDFFANPVNKAREHFSTIFMDSLTEIAEVVLANAKIVNKDPRQAYGDLIEKMMDTVKKFRDLQGFHFVATAKIELVKEENGGSKFYPAMPGSKVGPGLPYYFDEVFRLGIHKDPASGAKWRFLQTDPDMQYTAKDRSGLLAEIEQPNINYIIHKILGGSQA